MKFLSSVFSVLLTPLVAVMPLRAEMAATAGSVPVSIPSSVLPSPQTNALQIRLADPGNAVVEANSSLRGYSILVTDSAGLPVSEAAVAIRLPEDAATGFFADGAHSAVAYTNSAGVAVFAQVNWGSTLGVASIRVTAVKGEQHAGALIEQTIVAHSAAIPALKAQAKVFPPPPSASDALVTGLAPSPKPGTPASVASVQTGASTQQPPVRPAETAASPEPVVSIVNSGGSHSGSNKKWIILAAVAAGAGVGAALAMSGKGSTSTGAAATGVSIGTPTISLGHFTIGHGH